MNKRILSPQLLKLVQAAGPGYSQANPEWVKKFAELIVRECAEVADNADATRQKWEGIGKYVKEYFGVEE